MSWADSRVFAAWIANPVLGNVSGLPTGYAGLTADVVKAALYNGSITPDRTAAVASTGYNTGQWASTNEVTGSSEWVAGGRTLSGAAVSNASGVVTYSANNLVGSATLTMSGINGCLVYDNAITGGTVAKQGFCYNYFGGSLGVTSGTFTLNWSLTGIATFTT